MKSCLFPNAVRASACRMGKGNVTLVKEAAEWVYTVSVYASMIPCVAGCFVFFLNVSGLLWFPGLLGFGATRPPSHSSRCRSWPNQFRPAHWFQSVKVVWRRLECTRSPTEPPSLHSLYPVVMTSLVKCGQVTGWLGGFLVSESGWYCSSFRLWVMQSYSPPTGLCGLQLVNWILGHFTSLGCQILHSWV